MEKSMLRMLLIAVFLLGANFCRGPPGEFDSKFGIDGFARVFSNNTRGAKSSFIRALPDGKFLVIGNGPDSSSATGIFVARFNEMGTLDSTFGLSGVLNLKSLDYNATAQAVQILDDGQILIVSKGAFSPEFFLIATNGLTHTLSPLQNADLATRFAVQNDGKIVGGSSFFTQTGRTCNLRRWLMSGEVDLSFGNAGVVVFGRPGDGSHCELDEIQITSTGDHLFAYSVSIVVDFSFQQGRQFVGRLNSSGQMDPNFGADGRIELNAAEFPYRPVKLFAKSNGAVLLASAPSGLPPSSGVGIEIREMDRRGRINGAFGIGGRISLGVQSLPEILEDTYGCLYVLAQGKVTRFRSGGLLDSSFGENGTFARSIGFDLGTTIPQISALGVVAISSNRYLLVDALEVQRSDRGSFQVDYSLIARLSIASDAELAPPQAVPSVQPTWIAMMLTSLGWLGVRRIRQQRCGVAA
jgi:Domain of unknown function (DUF5122) beta-propeller